MTEIHHGELRGWARGCREDCCRVAMLTYNRKLYNERVIYGDKARRRIDATGTKRRLQGLMMMGWTGQEIAEECGWENRQAVTVLMTRKLVRRTTAELVHEVHERLWRRWLAGELEGQTHYGMRKRSINKARSKGWVPSAAWDDIDNPRDRPKGVALPELTG